MTHKNPQKTLKKPSLRPSSALRMRIDEQGLLRARVSASAGEFNISPEIVHLLSLLQQGVGIPALASRLRQDFKQLTAELPHQAEIESLVEEMKDAQCLVDSSEANAKISGIQDGFGDPWIQWAMLADRPRCDAYRRALKESLNERAHVLDVGAGTGLLSIYSIDAGARRVDAIEETASAKILTKVKQALPAGKKEKFFIHNQNSSDVELPSQITHVVSELFGNDPLQEGVIQTLRDIFARLDSKSVQGIPESVEVFAQCIELTDGPLKPRLAKLAENNTASSEDWIKAVRLIQTQLNFTNTSFAHPIRRSDFKDMGSLTNVFKIPLAPPPSPASARPSGQLKIKISSDMKSPALLLCFRAHLTKKISISNIPGEADECEHWSPIIVPLSARVSQNEFLDVRVGVSEEWEQLTAEVKNKQGQLIGSRR